MTITEETQAGDLVQLPSNLKTLSHPELVDHLHHTEDEAARIGQQLADAKSRAHVDRDYSDPDWFRRANVAFSIKKKLIRKIQGEFSRRKTERGLPKGPEHIHQVDEVSLSDMGPTGLQDYLNAYDDRWLVAVISDGDRTFVIWRVRQVEVPR